MRWLIAAVVSLLTTTWVGLAATGGWFYWERVLTRSEQETRIALPPLAAKEIPQVFGYDYQTIERSLTEVYPLLAPGFREDFKSQANRGIIPEARKRGVVSQVSVAGVGVMSVKRDSASVMVYMNRTVTDKDSPEKPVYEGSRLRVDYLRIGGKWLINLITPI
jgi:Mce-associated membrane protein